MQGFVAKRLFFLLFLLTTGCTTISAVPAGDVLLPSDPQRNSSVSALTDSSSTGGDLLRRLDPAKKVPLNVGIFISDENYAATVLNQQRLSVPFGQILKNKSLDVFSHYFADVILTRFPSHLPNIDAIIIPTITDYRYENIDTTGFGFWTSSRVDAQITVKVTMPELKGPPIWEKTMQSPRVIGKEIRVIDRGKPEYLVELKRIGPEAVNAALQEVARDMFMSGDVRNLVSAMSKTKAIAAQPSHEVSRLVKSDVDELPVIKIKQNKNAYAVVIGIEQYRQKLPQADFAVSDVKLVSTYLSRVMGYPEENIVTLTNENAALGDFVKYFEKWLPNNIEKDSTVFIYYSGHGAPNTKTGDAYLVPYDGDPSFIDQTGYSLKRMYDALGKLPAKSIIVALDSCFSGAGGRSVIAKGARPLVMNIQSDMALSKNMTVLSASSGEQISSTYDEKGHGLFTYFLLKGIMNEDVVKPDGSINMDDLFGYIKPQVERIARKQYNNEQTPQLIGAKKN